MVEKFERSEEFFGEGACDGGTFAPPVRTLSLRIASRFDPPSSGGLERATSRFTGSSPTASSAPASTSQARVEREPFRLVLVIVGYLRVTLGRARPAR